MKNRNLSKFFLVFISVIAVAPSISYAGELADENVDKIMKTLRASDKYACTPEQLANYIDRSSASLKMTPSIPTSIDHIKNKAIKDKENGEESCVAAFGDLQVIKDFNKIMEYIQSIDPSSWMTSGDAIMTALNKLADEFMEAAKNGICGQLTAKAANKLVNSILKQKLGYDLNDAEKFDSKKFAKKHATNYAEGYATSKGVDKRIVHEDKWEKMFGDQTQDQYKEMKSNMFK